MGHSPGAGARLGQGGRLSSKTARSGQTDRCARDELEGRGAWRSPGLQSPSGLGLSRLPWSPDPDALTRGLLSWLWPHWAAKARPGARPISCCPTAQHPRLRWPWGQGLGGCRTGPSVQLPPLGARVGRARPGPQGSSWRHGPCSRLFCSVSPTHSRARRCSLNW